MVQKRGEDRLVVLNGWRVCIESSINMQPDRHVVITYKLFYHRNIAANFRMVGRDGSYVDAP